MKGIYSFKKVCLRIWWGNSQRSIEKKNSSHQYDVTLSNIMSYIKQKHVSFNFTCDLESTDMWGIYIHVSRYEIFWIVSKCENGNCLIKKIYRHGWGRRGGGQVWIKKRWKIICDTSSIGKNVLSKSNYEIKSPFVCRILKKKDYIRY